MKRLFVITSILIFWINTFGSLKVLENYHIRYEQKPESAGKVIEMYPITRIYEIGNYCFVTKTSSIDIYTKNFEFQKTIGRRGNGPGDFLRIKDITKYDKFFYILDYPNRLNLYDSNLKFIRRNILSEKYSNQSSGSLNIYKNKIYLSQGNAKLNTCITVYSRNGEHLESFFLRDHGFQHLGEKRFLSSRSVRLIGGHLFFAFHLLPIVWKINQNGEIQNEVELEDSISPVKFNKRQFQKESQHNMVNAFRNVLFSGDLITFLWNWQNNLLIQILKQNENKSQSCLIIYNQQLEPISKLLHYKDYHFVGCGKYIYFAKELKNSPDDQGEDKVEVIKCSYEF